MKVRGVGQLADRVHQRDAGSEGLGAEVGGRVVPDDPPVDLAELPQRDLLGHARTVTGAGFRPSRRPGRYDTWRRTH